MRGRPCACPAAGRTGARGGWTRSGRRREILRRRTAAEDFAELAAETGESGLLAAETGESGLLAADFAGLAALKSKSDADAK